MKNLLRFLAFVLMVGGAYAQSKLPACPLGDEKKISNCWGRFVYGLGTVWVGELKGGIPNGEGIIYSNGGKVLESGILNGTSLISSYKIDPSRYPYEILGGAYVQSNLPACLSSGYFHNCFGTHTFNNGNKYIGEYRDDKHNGQGTLSFANGTRYVGEFKDDKYNGQGTYTFASGHKYVGEFKDGKQNGQGTFNNPNGDKNVGGHKDGKYNGQGTYFYLADNQFKGHQYVGEYKDGKKHGQGTYTFSDGRKYVGEWSDGKNNGQGTFTYANGDKYIGEFKDDEYNGQGTLYASNGSVIRKGIWTDGKFFGSEQVQQAATPSVHPSSSERGRLASVSKLPACQTQS